MNWECSISSPACSEVTSVCFSVSRTEERWLHMYRLSLSKSQSDSWPHSGEAVHRVRSGTTGPCFLRDASQKVKLKGACLILVLPAFPPLDSQTSPHGLQWSGHALFPRSFFSFCPFSLSLPFLSSLTHLSTFRYSETQRWSSRACCLATGRKPALCGGGGFM